MKRFIVFFVSIVSFALCAQDAEREINLTGFITKDNKRETLYFDMQIEGREFVYALRGATKTDPGTVWSEVDFSNITVNRQVFNDNGRTFMKKFDNSGAMYVYLRDRQIKESTVLAGVPVSGEFTQGLYVDDGLWVGSLSINNVSCTGAMDYNCTNGRYNASNCKLGDYCLSSSEEGSSCFINYDTWNFNPLVGLNEYNVTMKFGGLLITGTITFTDNIETDSKGNQVVRGTKGLYSCKIRKADGTSFFLIPRRVGGEVVNNELPQVTDKAIRNFFVYLQLFSYDMFAE